MSPFTVNVILSVSLSYVMLTYVKIPLSVALIIFGAALLSLTNAVEGIFTSPLNVLPLSLLSIDNLNVFVSLTNNVKLSMACWIFSSSVAISCSVLSMSMKQNLLSLYCAPSS